ncbi:MAG: hypothetical protein V1913_13110 [Fibrobacterota bacterium]
MEPSQIKPSEALSATVQEIQSYPKYTRRSVSGSLPPVLHTTVNDLVKDGKLTQEQAKLVLGANQMNMFGTLLDAMQNPYGTNSTDSSLASADPASALLDALKANDDTEKSGSPLFDTLAGLMPTYEPPAAK